VNVGCGVRVGNDCASTTCRKRTACGETSSVSNQIEPPMTTPFNKTSKPMSVNHWVDVKAIFRRGRRFKQHPPRYGNTAKNSLMAENGLLAPFLHDRQPKSIIPNGPHSLPSILTSTQLHRVTSNTPVHQSPCCVQLP